MAVSKEDAALEHQALVSMANDAFGVLLWSHAVTHQSIDFVDKDGGYYSAGVTAFVKVELKSGVYHQEAGYGAHSDKSKGMAVAVAQKRAVTTAFKEALRSFNGEITKRLKQNSLPAVTESKPAVSVDQSPIVLCKTPPAQKHNSPNNFKNVVQSSIVGNSNVKLPAANVVNHTPEPLPVAGSCTNMDLDDIEMKLERKRRQKLKQEEFLKKLKQKQTEDPTDSKCELLQNNVQNNGSVQVSDSTGRKVLAVDIEDEALISTQEMNQMVQSAAVSGVSPKDNNKVPLFNSPTANKPTMAWSGSKENNTLARKLPFKNALSTRKGPLQQSNWQLPFKNKV